MPGTLSPEATRNVIIDHVEALESLPYFQEPTPEMYEGYRQRDSAVSSEDS
jgi:hypothetical protein